MKKSLPVTQSNQVIDARYRLTRDEQKLMRIIISSVRKDDEDFGEYEFPIGDIVDMMKINKDSAYQKIKALTKRLLTRVVEIRDDSEKKYLQFSWVSVAEYKERRGTVIFSIHPKLKPYFLALQGHFTQYELKNVMVLNSTYGIRFYELGKKNIGLNQKSAYMPLEDIRDWLELKKTQYKTINNFKTRILEPAKKEINKNTDIKFNYEPVRKGRGGKVVGYNLEFSSKNKEIVKDSPISNSVTKIMDQFKALGIDDISSQNVQKWLDTYGAEKLRISVEVAQENRAKGKNVGAGLIVKALDNDWLSNNEKNRQEQQKFSEGARKKVEAQKIKEKVIKLSNTYNDEVWNTAQKWFKRLPDDEQEAFNNQYLSQNSFIAEKEKKAPSPTSSFNAHVTMLYKRNNPVDSFTIWLEKNAKKKKIAITKEMLLAVAEIR